MATVVIMMVVYYFSEKEFVIATEDSARAKTALDSFLALPKESRPESVFEGHALESAGMGSKVYKYMGYIFKHQEWNGDPGSLI